MSARVWVWGVVVFATPACVLDSHRDAGKLAVVAHGLSPVADKMRTVVSRGDQSYTVVAPVAGAETLTSMIDTVLVGDVNVRVDQLVDNSTVSRSAQATIREGTTAEVDVDFSFSNRVQVTFATFRNRMGGGLETTTPMAIEGFLTDATMALGQQPKVITVSNGTLSVRSGKLTDLWSGSVNVGYQMPGVDDAPPFSLGDVTLAGTSSSAAVIVSDDYNNLHMSGYEQLLVTNAANVALSGTPAGTTLPTVMVDLVLTYNAYY
jgi:hypothetical protein